MKKTYKSPNGHHLAFNALAGNSPTIVYLGGFMSDMTGDKALALEEDCRNHGHAFLRFDYSGHGASSGSFEQGHIGSWLADTLNIIEHATEGPILLIASSMGAWLALHTALKLRTRVCGLITIAAAIDFTDWALSKLNKAQIELIKTQGYIKIPHKESEDPYLFTSNLIEKSQPYLLLKQDINLDIPIRLIHGEKDQEIPWGISLKLSEKLKSSDIELTLIKDGEHRLSTNRNITLIKSILHNLIETVATPSS